MDKEINNKILEQAVGGRRISGKEFASLDPEAKMELGRTTKLSPDALKLIRGGVASGGEPYEPCPYCDSLDTVYGGFDEDSLRFYFFCLNCREYFLI